MPPATTSAPAPEEPAVVFAIVTEVELSDITSVPLMPKVTVDGAPPGALIEK